MPIKFRCSHCGQMLSITRRKAGMEVTCPQCVHRIQVPQLTAAEQVIADEPDDDSNMRLSVAQHQVDDQQARNIWRSEVNRWTVEEDEEEEFACKKAKLSDDGLDMTPMVDVTFLLLIFFMTTASFSLQKSMETTPPEPPDDAVSQTVNLEDLEDNSVVVEIDGEDVMRVDDAPVSGLSELVDVLTAKIANEQKTELLIEADPGATHGMVVGVTDAAMDAGMQRIRRSSKSNDD